MQDHRQERQVLDVQICAIQCAIEDVDQQVARSYEEGLPLSDAAVVALGIERMILRVRLACLMACRHSQVSAPRATIYASLEDGTVILHVGQDVALQMTGFPHHWAIHLALVARECLRQLGQSACVVVTTWTRTLPRVQAGLHAIC